MRIEEYTSGETESVEALREQAAGYLNALLLVYDEVFEFDSRWMTVKRLRRGRPFGGEKAYPMQEAVARISGNLLPEDRGLLLAVFERFSNHSAGRAGLEAPFRIEFRIFAGGVIKSCMGVFLTTGENTYLFCCSDVTGQRENERLRREYRLLSQEKQQVLEVLRIYSGELLVFRVENGIVKPFTINETICDFFGVSREDWFRFMKSGGPIDEFLANSCFSYEDYERLLREGEIEVNYIEVSNDAERRMRARCISAPGERSTAYYILLRDITDDRPAPAQPTPAGESARAEAEEPRRPEVFIRTFGYFDVFVDGKPIAFKNEKTKELFAILVDRRGGYVSSGEAIGYLWENEPANKITLSRYRKVALRLKNFLDEHGIADIVESVDGKRRVVTERVRCDLYDYLSRDPQYEHLFNGLYLLNYSWAETTLGELQSISGQTAGAAE